MMRRGKILTAKAGPSLCKTLLLILCLLGATRLQAQALQQKSSSLTKAFRVNSQAPIRLSGKYGKMSIVTWDKPEVRVAIEVSVSGNSMADVEKMLERVSISITGDANGVFATTNIADTQQWNQSQDALRIQFKDGARLNLRNIDIQFEVYMPKNNPLKVDNKYGDLDLGSLSGTTEIWLKYGDLQAERLDGRNEVHLGYAKANIGYFGTGHVEASYSEADFDQIQTLRLNSKNSEIRIGSADSLIAGNKYNDYTIGEVEILLLDEQHGDVAIRRVGKGADVIMKYGEFTVASLGPNFDLIRFDGNRTDATIAVGAEHAYSLDAAATHCRIAYPPRLKLSEQISTPDYQKIVGKVGGNGKGVIHIRTDSGIVRVE